MHKCLKRWQIKRQENGVFSLNDILHAAVELCSRLKISVMKFAICTPQCGESVYEKNLFNVAVCATATQDGQLTKKHGSFIDL